jgi:hypothetical protein
VSRDLNESRLSIKKLTKSQLLAYAQQESKTSLIQLRSVYDFHSIQIKDDDLMERIQEAIQKTAHDIAPNSGYCTKEELRRVIKKRFAAHRRYFINSST